MGLTYGILPFKLKLSYFLIVDVLTIKLARFKLVLICFYFQIILF